jgi:hypothetical protein
LIGDVYNQSVYDFRGATEENDWSVVGCLIAGFIWFEESCNYTLFPNRWDDVVMH